MNNGFEWVGGVDARPSARGEASRFKCNVMRWQPGSHTVTVYEETRDGKNPILFRTGEKRGEVKSLKAGKEIADRFLREEMARRGWRWTWYGRFRVLCVPAGTVL